MKVPLFGLKDQNAVLKNELTDAFERVLTSGNYILGPEAEAFDREIEAFLGVKHAIGVSSGTDAILLALMTLGLKPGDEVLCPAFTFFATAGCVARLGATPVFVDVGDDYCIDPEDIEKKITPKTKGIIPVALFGQAPQMDAVLRIAHDHNLWVIEDAAQALGASYKGKAVGTLGTFGIYSFYPTKNLGGFGDAGMLVTQNDTLAEKAKVLRVHGAKPRYHHHFIGGNFRIDGIQAALLRVKLPHLKAYNEKRCANAERYAQAFSQIPGASTVPSEATSLVIPSCRSGNTHIWHQYTIRVIGSGRRDALKNYLEKEGIGTDVYYPISLDKQVCFHGTSRGEGIVFSHRFAEECISLPIFPELKVKEQAWVIETVRQFFS